MQVRRGSFEHFCALNNIRRQDVEREFAAIIVRRNRASIQKHCVEFRSKTTNSNELTFATAAVNRDTGDPLQGFSNVGVREFADVFRGDRVDNLVGVSLDIEGGFQAPANAFDGNGLERPFVGGLACFACVLRDGRSAIHQCGDARPNDHLGFMAHDYPPVNKLLFFRMCAWAGT